MAQAIMQTTTGSPIDSFGPVKQIEAGLLNVGYVEAGPADGPAVILVHGWPYDIHSFAEVTPILASSGFRVVVPYLRGYGSTRFLSDQTMRNGQQSVVAVDTIALMDALEIDKAIVAGFDWGARTADIVAALWPERCNGLVSVSGYLIGNQNAGKIPLPPEAELEWWYQYYFATERGRAGYDKNRHDFAKLIWRTASPKWNFDDATFERSAASFENPDHVAIVTHNYRWRLGLGEGETQYDDLEQQLAASPLITVPTITLEGEPSNTTSPTRWQVNQPGILDRPKTRSKLGAVAGDRTATSYTKAWARDLWRLHDLRLQPAAPSRRRQRRADREPWTKGGDTWRVLRAQFPPRARRTGASRTSSSGTSVCRTATTTK
jgi:pimeloyl-ACP methyl ester carboxylesterase